MKQIFMGKYTNENIATRLKIKIEKLHGLQNHINSSKIYSLDKPLNETNKKNLYDIIIDEDYQCPQELIETEEIKLLMIKALNKLPPKIRLAIILHYYEKYTFKKISKILGVSESRISQINTETKIK